MTKRMRSSLVSWILVLAGCGVAAEAPPLVSGGCVADPDCDDGLACTVDTCTVTVGGARACAHAAHDDRCAAGEVCVAGTGGGCVVLARLWCAGKEEWASCAPDDQCALGLGFCRDGLCTYEVRECPDQACLASRGCDPATGFCAYADRPDGTPCALDALACTVESCVGGACVLEADDCECTPDRACPTPEDLCRGTPTCEDGRCIDHPVACEPNGAPCLENLCEPATGECVEVPVTDGLACVDDLVCTVNETCRQGTCDVEDLVCEARPCLAAACVEPEGCGWLPADEGLDCDDGDRCNGPDRCTSGQCLPFLAPVDCDDGDPCTSDACAPATGDCSHAFVPDCCGNRVVENGEQCDTGPEAAGCRDCRWTTVHLAADGRAVAAVWGSGDSGFVAYEDLGQDEGARLVVRRLHRDGRVDPATSVPGALAATQGFRPAMATMDGGRLLLATFEQDGLVLRVLDEDLGVRGRLVVEPASGAATGEPLRLGVLDGLAFVAYELGARPDSVVKLMRVPLAGFGDEGPQPTPVIDQTVVGLLAGLGDLCVGKGNVLVTYWFRDATYGLMPRADLFGTDLALRWDYTPTFANARIPSTVRCARWHPNTACDGFVLATDQHLYNQTELDEVRVSTRMICEDTGNPGMSQEVLSSRCPTGQSCDLALSAVSSALAAVDGGYMYALPFNVLRPSPTSHGFEARVLVLDDEAEASGPALSPGDDLPTWVSRVALTDIPGPTMLMFGIAKPVPTDMSNAGLVWARILPDR